MNYEITRDVWNKCLVCNKSLSDIKKEIGGKNVYFTRAFLKHLENHGISRVDYFSKICGLEPVLCECGCGKQVSVGSRGSKMFWNKLACGKNKGVVSWSEKAKVTRKGAGNPMFGKTSWNDGLTKETNETMKRISDMAIKKGWTPSKEMRKANSAWCIKNKPHLGHKHSEYSKNIMREKTSKRISLGCFPQTKSKPHVVMSEILKEAGVFFREEQLVICYTFDFFLPDYDLFIEVDGDYFHSNPKFYPNGPINKTQKRNATNDKNKNFFCEKHKMRLLRFWEHDILNNRQLIKEELKCVLKI